jgi:hypothetical protein
MKSNIQLLKRELLSLEFFFHFFMCKSEILASDLGLILGKEGESVLCVERYIGKWVSQNYFLWQLLLFVPPNSFSFLSFRT